MRLTGRVDLALRAATELAAEGAMVTAPELARRQGASYGFLVAVLSQLRAGGIVRSVRGREGGFELARPAAEVALADVIRCVDGPLALIAGDFPEQHTYPSATATLQDVWLALRENERSVLERVTLADVAAGRLPPELQAAAERGRVAGPRSAARAGSPD